ncbi:hypothetical protein M3P21_22090 [Ruegeria sp. 2012CJ41-6]|uniref:Uncharacterized protein n=1 Tax=Ruegeria spongiae TaxID=2942209 RepID=A0ABT0Q9V7_9RHOB|nr:hypothetical protein [Ruegeria spongiae]MCL6286187.1 hypothetical protein [Ruegeria spongiae]
MSRIYQQMAAYELESLLYEIDDKGYVVVALERLYRLLGKGNRAAGTWRALLDAWEEIDGEREDLYMLEMEGTGNVLLTSEATSPVARSAGEAE